MRFLLRCVFWLSIVYASILSPGIFSSHGDLARGVASAKSTIDGASALCRDRTEDCLRVAAHLASGLGEAEKHGLSLTELVAAAAADDHGHSSRSRRPHTADERVARER